MGIFFALLAILGILIAAAGLLLPPIQALLPRLSMFFYYRQALVRRLLILTGMVFAVTAIIFWRTAFAWVALIIVMFFLLAEELLLVPRKVIPPLDDPPAKLLQTADLPGQALVIGINIGTRSHAYPLSVLIPHHIINETIADQPVAATYCPACRSGYVYDPVVQGQRLTFEPVSVHRRNMIMRDRETGTVWQHETGLALMGPFKGERLHILESEMCNWMSWAAEHPATTLCQPPEGYRHPSPLGHVFEKMLDHGPEHLVGPGLRGQDHRLGQHDFVIGLVVAGKAKAYPLERLKKAGIISDNAGEMQVILVYEAEADRVRAYKGKVGGEEIPVVRQWWLAWSEYHPGSEVYE
jgi:hypothetical protein